MVVAIAHDAGAIVQRAVRDSCESAGARDVHLIARPLAAGIGSGLDVARASGHMVLDLGAGSTSASILSLGAVVGHRKLAHGALWLEQRIQEDVLQRHGLLIGRPTATQLKHELASAHSHTVPRACLATGRCARRGVPRSAEVTTAELAPIVQRYARDVSGMVRALLDAAPPELASDILETGIVLTGGGGNLDGIEHAIGRATGLAIVRAPDPHLATIRGASTLLERRAYAQDAYAVL
jgi:rod shape-determining protein MreB